MDAANSAKEDRRKKGLAPAWKPGQSGNPSGRPPMPPELRRKALNAAPDALDVAIGVALDAKAARVARLECEALAGAGKPVPRELAAKAACPHSASHVAWAVDTVLDRALGRPEQAVNVTGEAGPLAGVPAEERGDVIAEMVVAALARVAAKRQAAQLERPAVVDVPALPSAQLEAAVPVDPKPDPEKP